MEIPTPNLIAAALDNHTVTNPDPPRSYLGASELGNECARYLWYSFRKAFRRPVTPLQERYFTFGTIAEKIIVKQINDAGMKTRNTLEDQLEVIGPMGHVKGHPDGVVREVPGYPDEELLLEIKTAKGKKWNEFYRFGVRRSSPTYYGQAQYYMNKLGLVNTLFICWNKETSELYPEVIPYDKDFFEELEEKAFDILSSPVPLPKLSEKSEFYKCRWCDAKKVCHQNEPIAKGCRTCEHSKLMAEGVWLCGLHPEWGPVPLSFQLTGCETEWSPLI